MKPLKILLLVHEDLIPPDPVPLGTDTTAVEWKTEFDVKVTLQGLGHHVLAVGIKGEISPLRRAIKEFEPDIVFNLLEEFDGDVTYDHHIVSFLELHKVAYTGCNPRGLLLARDKALSKKILKYHRIQTPNFMVVPKGHKVKLKKNLHLPVIVKSLIEESSLGISKASVVESEKDLIERVNYIHQSLKTDVILESYISGREFYVGVLGNHRLEAFPIWELHFGDLKNEPVQIATQHVKWNDKYRKRHKIKSRNATDLDPLLVKRIQTLCKKAYRKLDLSSYVRFDLRFSSNNQEAYILEANPNPGIAYGEDFPESAELSGYTYDDLIEKILKLGLNWHTARR